MDDVKAAAAKNLLQARRLEPRTSGLLRDEAGEKSHPGLKIVVDYVRMIIIVRYCCLAGCLQQIERFAGVNDFDMVPQLDKRDGQSPDGDAVAPEVGGRVKCRDEAESHGRNIIRRAARMRRWPVERTLPS